MARQQQNKHAHDMLSSMLTGHSGAHVHQNGRQALPGIYGYILGKNITSTFGSSFIYCGNRKSPRQSFKLSITRFD